METKLARVISQEMVFKRFISQNKMVFIFILLVVVSAIVSGDFMTSRNISNILRQVSVNGILACGMTFVMLTGGFDLSVGSLVSLAAVIAIGSQEHLGVAGAILVTLIIGALAGSMNGAVLSKINANSGDAFMITLGSQLAFAGIALLYTNARVLPGSKSVFYSSLGQGTLFGFIPAPVFVFLLIAAISHFVLSMTILGRKIYMIGGNYEAARLSGIRVKLYKCMVYSIAGISAAVAGIILSSRTLGGSPLAGVGYELDAIAAVIVGGISLKGGEGSIPGTLLGVFIIGVLSNILNLLGMSSFNQMVIKGMVIVLAVWLARKRT
jgi:ribose transport system permease protein